MTNDLMAACLTGESWQRRSAWLGAHSSPWGTEVHSGSGRKQQRLVEGTWNSSTFGVCLAELNTMREECPLASVPS